MLLTLLRNFWVLKPVNTIGLSPCFIGTGCLHFYGKFLELARTNKLYYNV